jgi:hypothetical protein
MEDSVDVEGQLSAAVREQEEALAEKIREKLQAKSTDRVPLWLYPDLDSITLQMSVEEIREKDVLYSELSHLLRTADPVVL